MSKRKENIIFIHWLSASAGANSRIDDLKQQQKRKNRLTLLKVTSHAGAFRGVRLRLYWRVTDLIIWQTVCLTNQIKCRSCLPVCLSVSWSVWLSVFLPAVWLTDRLTVALAKDHWQLGNEHLLIIWACRTHCNDLLYREWPPNNRLIVHTFPIHCPKHYLHRSR